MPLRHGVRTIAWPDVLKMEEMNIKFSRHAKRRMRLYDISESTVQKRIESFFGAKSSISSGKNEIIDDLVISGQKYPLKIVFSYEENHITIITAYPLKRGKK